MAKQNKHIQGDYNMKKEKVVFIKQNIKESSEAYPRVRIKPANYEAVKDIAAQSYLPMVDVMAELIDFALEHTVILNPEDIDNGYENK